MKGKAAALSVRAQRCQSHYFSTTPRKNEWSVPTSAEIRFHFFLFNQKIAVTTSWGSPSSVAEDSNLLGCYAILTLLAFWRNSAFIFSVQQCKKMELLKPWKLLISWQSVTSQKTRISSLVRQDYFKCRFSSWLWHFVPRIVVPDVSKERWESVTEQFSVTSQKNPCPETSSTLQLKPHIWHTLLKCIGLRNVSHVHAIGKCWILSFPCPLLLLVC